MIDSDPHAVVARVYNEVRDPILSNVPLATMAANANLIAAAPEMLEILEELALYPEARSYPDGPCLRSEDMEEIDRIIAKATGKEVV